MRKGLFCIGVFLFMAFSNVCAQYRWTDLGGPYWAGGIDAAYCGFNISERGKILIGTDNSIVERFGWDYSTDKWISRHRLDSAKKIVSYKSNNDRALYAFCIPSSGQIRLTTDGGNSWITKTAAPNDQYKTGDILCSETGDDITVFISSEPDDSHLSTFYWQGTTATNGT